MDRGLRSLKKYRKDRSQEKFPVVDSTMIEEFSPFSLDDPVVDSTMLIAGNGGNPDTGSMVDSHHYIATTMGSAFDAASIG